jgi:uncharacterized lipoprotein YehR (DUF1307 family)
MKGKKEGKNITLEDVDESYKRFMGLLERKDYNTEAGDDELDEDIIVEALSHSKEEKENYGR